MTVVIRNWNDFASFCNRKSRLLHHLKIRDQNVIYNDSRIPRLWCNNESYDLTVVKNVRALLKSFPNLPFCLFFYYVNC